RIRRIAPDAGLRGEDGVLAIDRFGSVGVADVAAGAVAGPAGAVIPAARVLRDVAADRALVADLRRGGGFRRVHQDRVAVADDRMPHDVGERRHRADLDAAVALAHPFQFVDATEIDDVARALDAVLQPVEAVETAGEDPCIAAVATEQRQRVRGGRRLQQLERGHYVSNYRHIAPRRA